MKTSFKFNNNHEKTICNAKSDNKIFTIDNIVITPSEYGYWTEPKYDEFMGVRYRVENEKFVQTGWKFFIKFPDSDVSEYFIPLNLDEVDNLTHIDFLNTLGSVMYIIYDFNTNTWKAKSPIFKFNEINDDYKQTVQNLVRYLIKKIEEVYGEK